MRYVYDVETRQYYLSSRFYTSEWLRFLSEDIILYGNLYCYCHNKPASRVDSLGKSDEDVNVDYNWDFENPNGYSYILVAPDERNTRVFSIPDSEKTVKVKRGTPIISLTNYADQYKQIATLSNGQQIIVTASDYVNYPPATIKEVFGENEIIENDGGIFVESVQRCLVALGYDMQVDGQFGRETTRMVKQYRKDYLGETKPQKTIGPTAKNDLFNRFYAFFDEYKRLAHKKLYELKP